MFDSIKKIDSILTWKKPTQEQVFKNIVGHEKAKDVLGSSVFTSNRTATLMIGPPGSAKSLFMMEICKKMKNWYFIDGTIASGKGLIRYMYEHQNAEGFCIDEIDKINKKDQTTMYNYLETGWITELVKKNPIPPFRMEKCKTIATSNSTDKLTAPLKSRFLTINIPPYTFDQFVEISIRKLGEDYKMQRELAARIADIVWNQTSTRDVRMLLHIGQRLEPNFPIEKIEDRIKNIIELSQLQSGQSGEYN